MAQGRKLGADDEPAEAAKLFSEALGLWRGPPLADVADLPFAGAEAARLEEARLSALEERIDADLACGRHGELVGESAGLTRDHPVRERFWAQRMTALYRAGRQTEALRAYQDLRRYLGDELGIEPAEDLRRLEGAILRHESELDWKPPATGARTAAASEGPDDLSPGVVSCLFTDLVAFTELADRPTGGAGDALRRHHVSAVHQALSTHGGREIKRLGDGVTAAFASPLAAVGAAVAIQQAMEAPLRDPGPPLSVRIGLHAGEVRSDDDDFDDSPAGMAQRLCDRARGGQILASALLRGLVGHRGDHSFRSLGGLALEGLAAPFAACEVIWAGPADRAVPLPLPLEREESSVFVGREAELSRLEAAWEVARSGRRKLVLLAGEPGIGKTRLATEIARLAHSDEAAVLFGRCDEGMGVPYQPVREALGIYLRQAVAPDLGRLGGELIRLVADIPDRVPGLAPPLRSDPETERYRLFDAVAAWLGAVSAQRPVLFVVDDLQWATRPTLQMLAHLVRSGEPLRLLVVASYRDTDLDVSAELADALAELLRQPGVDRLRMGGLDGPGVAAFVEARARHELDGAEQEFANAVHAETGGNPFFVGQLLRHLAETEALVRRDGRWVTGAPVSEMGIPEGVRDVIGRRLARLPDETREVLALGAVIGDRFDLDVLVRAAGAAEIAVLRALDPAIAARLVTEAGGATAGHRFVHALVRAGLYDGLPAARRLELHLRAGEAIEADRAAQLDDHLPALARHYARAGSTGRSRAFDYSARAGDRALRQLAHDEAAGWYRQALDLLDAPGQADDDTRRCDLLISLGEAERRAGDPAYRPTLLDAVGLAQELGDAGRLARAALAGNRGLFSVSDRVDADWVAVLEAALEALGPGDSGLRARLLVTLAAELVHSHDQGRCHRLAREGLALSRRLGDPETLGYTLSRGWVPAFAGPLDELRAVVTDLATVAAELGDPTLELFSVAWGTVTAIVTGDGRVAAAGYDAIDRLAGESGQPWLCWIAGLILTQGCQIAGRLADAEAKAHETWEFGAGLPDADRLFGTQLFWVRYEQGRVEELLERLSRAAARDGAFLITRAMFCFALFELDRLDAARSVFDAIALEDVANRQIGFGQLYTMTLLAQVCSGLGDAPAQDLLYERLAPCRSLVATVAAATTGPVARYLGQLASALGRDEQAEAHFEEAAGIAERLEAPTWLARIRLDWARLLLRRAGPADVEHAWELAAQALGTAEELGMARLAEQARALTRTGRLPPG